MSAISLKSITGITSITTPAGVDNQLTVHTNNTTERVRITSDGKVGIGTNLAYAKLEIGTGTETNSDTEYYGQDFAIAIRANRGDNAGDEGNGIVFIQKWDATNPNLVRTGAILGYKQSGTGNFGGGLIFKTQEHGASPMSEKLRITSAGQTIVKGFNGTGLKLEGSGGDYQGMQFVTTDSSASQTRNIFIDAVNETGAAVANMVGAVQADGGSKWEWQTQAVGNDRNDRRVTRLNINPDGEVGINSVSADGSTAVTNGTSVVKFGGFGDSSIPPNAVGGITVQVFADTISDDIKIPRNGHIMAVTSFTDVAGTTYPQPSGAGLIYVDVGTSKNLEIMTQNNVSGSLRVRDSRKTGINDLDDDGNDFFVDNKVTFMPGSTNGTIQIANRWNTSPNSTRIMFYLTFL